MPSDERPGAPAPPAATPDSRAAHDSLLAFADFVLAQSPAKKVAECEVRSTVTFFLGEKQLGIPILCSREIVRVGEITRIPEAPPHVLGVLNLRGRLVPVVELRTRLGLPAGVPSASSRVIVVEAHGRLFGLLVDRVSRIAKIPLSAVGPAEADCAGAGSVTGIARIGGESILLLDVDKVLRREPE